MFQYIAAAVCAVTLVACGGGSNKNTTPAVVQPAFQSSDTVVGSGTAATTGALLVVNYTGYLYDASKSDFKGAPFDSSYDRGTPFSFTVGVGAGKVIGWDQGILGADPSKAMKAGGKRTIILPASFGYGVNKYDAQPAVNGHTYAAIPANAPLVYDIELISVQPAVPLVPRDPPTTLTISDTDSGDVVGTGDTAVNGKTLTVKYTGYLWDGTRIDSKGAVFDSSVIKGDTTFDFLLGAGKVIPGWDQGLIGMKVGGKRTLVIPPALGYQATPQPASAPYTSPTGSVYTFVGIPANSTLIFDIELVGVK